MKLTNLSILILAAVAAFAQPGGGPPGGAGGQGDGIWRRNAYWGEGQTFDACVGHQPGNGDYHYHANPLCLRYQLGDNLVLLRQARTGPVYAEKTSGFTHSPILGWAGDGYPIYGPYGYSDPKDPKSAVRRLKSGFRLRNMTARTSLPDWSMPNHAGVSQVLTAAQYGPAISTAFPLGRYNEDFEWATGVGDLDQYNGRQEVTPEFPNGTYAYHVTIDENGGPAFPYIVAGEYYGTFSAARAQTVPAAAQDVTTANATAPILASWFTRNNTQDAFVITGYDPSGGPQTTWPTGRPAGASTSGGVSTATKADVQRVRFTDTLVYINSSGLSSAVMGPWFDPGMTGGVFSNFPNNNNNQVSIPRTAAPATTRTATGMGSIGMWVNGVSIYNFLDGSSYSNSTGRDAGGGGVTPSAIHVSAASFEQGPVAPGAIVTAYSLFGAQLAASTATAPSADWPTTLGGVSISVRDSAGVSRPANIYYASPLQVNYRIPAQTATGFATVTFTVGSTTVSSNINVLASYPHLFIDPATNVLGYALRVRNGQQTNENLTSPLTVNATDDVYLILYGSGLNTETTARATIGGVEARVAYAGPQGTYSGLDQFNILIPKTLTAKGKLPVVLTVGGRASNVGTLTVQ